MSDAVLVLAQQPAPALESGGPPPDAPGLFGDDFTNGAIALTVVFLLGLSVIAVVLLSRKKPEASP